MSIQFVGSGENARLLTISDVAAALQVSKSSVYRLFNEGELGWVQIGSHRRVTLDEITRFINDHSSESRSA